MLVRAPATCWRLFSVLHKAQAPSSLTTRVAGAVEYYYIISIVNGLSGAYDVYRFA